MTPNPINAVRITIYNTQHTNNTQKHFQQSQHNLQFRKPIFIKTFEFEMTSVYAGVYDIIYILYIVYFLYIEKRYNLKHIFTLL